MIWLGQTSVPNDKDVEYYSPLYLRPGKVVLNDWNTLLWGVADGMALREILSGRLKHMSDNSRQVQKGLFVDCIYYLDFEEEEIEVWKWKKFVGHIRFSDLSRTDLRFWGVDVEDWGGEKCWTRTRVLNRASSSQPFAIPDELFANSAQEIERAKEAARKEAEAILAKVAEKVSKDQEATTEKLAESESTSKFEPKGKKPIPTQFSSETFNFDQQPIKNPFVKTIKPMSRKTRGKVVSGIIVDAPFAKYSAAHCPRLHLRSSTA